MYTETEKPIRCRAFQTNANVAADIFFIESKNVPPDRRSQISYKTDVICPVTFISSSV